MQCPLLFTLWRWVLLSASVVCVTGNLNMDMFRDAIRDGFPDKDINMVRLLHEYTTICPYLSQCDLDHVVEPGPFVYSRSEVSIPSCRPCSCSHYCMRWHNCCPGNAYQYWQYKQVNLVVHGQDRPPVMAYAIGHCPRWYRDDEQTILLCIGNEYGVFPAISRNTKLTYKNKFCAACHNETDLQYESLQLKCFGNKDDLSKKTADSVKTSDCWATFYSPRKITSDLLYAPSNDDVITTCNVTGLWKEFDEDVNWACENTVNLYQGFKNVFCYICNPSVSSTRPYTLVETCNTTGNWMVYNPNIENACRLKPQTQRLFPFKNIHCMICNGREDNFNGNTFISSIAERIYPSHIDISLQFHTSNAPAFFEEMHSLFNISGIRLKVPPLKSVDIKEKIGNISDVIDTYESVCGRRGSCRTPEDEILTTDVNTNCGFNSYALRYNSKLCSCSSACAEYLQCCADLVLKFSPYNCVSPNYFQWTGDTASDADVNLPTKILVIDECVTDRTVDTFNFNFTNIPSNVLNIPVRTRTNIMYKNIIYLLCNSGKQTAYMDLQVRCNRYIEYRLYMNSIELLQTINKYCSIHFLTPNARRCSKEIKPVHPAPFGRARFTPTKHISENVSRAITSAFTWAGWRIFTQCNQTKMWQVEQSDIRLICEDERFIHMRAYHMNGYLYKNFACFVCNPLLRGDETDHVISTCNVTGAEEERKPSVAVVMQCNITDYQNRFSPFKNHWCSECNLPHEKYLDVFDDDIRDLSTLFAISEEEWQKLHLKPKSADALCLNESTYQIEDQCHDVKCSTYHYLENGICKSLLDTSMAYILSFKLNFPQSPSSSPLCNQQYEYCDAVNLEFLVERIVEYLLTYIAIDHAYSYRYHGYVDSSCDRNTQVFKPSVSSMVSFSITFFYNTNLEKELLEFVTSEHVLNITHDYEPSNRCTLVFQLVQSPFPIMVDNDPHLHHEGQCYFTDNVTPKFGKGARLDESDILVVDRFLLCPQLEFNSDKYHYNSKTDTVTIIKGQTIFPSSYFKRQGNATRICLEDYKAMLSQPVVVVENSLIQAYHIFSDIVIGISLTSLALTFATYCMSPSLRTLPGRNIMLLTACLFCAQVLLLVALRLESDTLVCKIMGILLHYSWLATYCAMNVCSFHLFNVFYINMLTKASPSDDNKRFSGYVIYTLGVPLLVVATIICTYAIPSHGQTLGYGKMLCFLSDINASIAAFITPSMLVFKFNIVFFGLAFHKIRTTAKVQTSRKADRSDLFICLRICTIVGIAGPLYLMNSFIGFSYFSFVVEGINSTQGLLIFLSYICNGRVLAQLREKLNLDHSNKATQSKSTMRTHSTQK